MNLAGVLREAWDFLAGCFPIGILAGLVPAFLIAGGFNIFIPKQLVFKYLGAKTPKPLSYGVATVAGTVLSV